MIEETVGVEIDLADLPREVLEMLIKISCEKDVSTNKVISEILEDFLKQNS